MASVRRSNRNPPQHQGLSIKPNSPAETNANDISTPSDDDQSRSILANGQPSKRTSHLSSPSSSDQTTPKRVRLTSKQSDSSDHHDNFTPKSTKRSAAKGRRGRPRGRARASTTKERASGRSTQLPRVKKTRKRNPKNLNPQADHDGNETNQENPEAAVNPQAEYQIYQDNDLFNTIRMGVSAIQPTLEDWLDVYQASGEDDENPKGQAIALLINFVLRCCGCNCSIDQHKALDIDAVTDTLDTIQETFKKVPSQAYPLIVKSGKSVSKNFRKNLISLCHQLILLAHSSTILYDQSFIPLLQSYLVSMSSSTLRSFRHTSTVISLFGFVSPMCELLVSAKKELTSLSRKVEVEAAKKHLVTSKLAQLAEWQKRKDQVLKEKTGLENFIGEFFDGVFVHRYRDADPSIRVDCVQALGQWMSMVPDYFLEGNYLRYIGWVITDSNKDARNEALRVLSTLYSKEENMGVMQHFTSRFRPRLIEMATGESDLTTRGLSINIVTHLDRHGLLDSRERNRVGRLIYHEDSRVRKAASAFFGNLFEETLDARKMRLDAITQSSTKDPGKKSRTAEWETQIAFKCLAQLLLKLERDSKHDSTDGSEGDGQSNNSEDELQNEEDDPELAAQYLGSSLYQNDMDKGRIDFAVEDLWPRVEILHDWQALCHYLLLDHTASTNRPSIPVQPSRSSVSLANTDVDGSAENETHQDSSKDHTNMDDSCKLSEPEEAILVEVLVASLRKFGATLTATEALKMRKRKRKRLHPEATDEEGATTEDERRVHEPTEDEPENKTDLTRTMISLLPKLWSKFMTDPVKLAEVFRIPKLMYLDLYLDLRMVSAFEDMWDTMIKHYLKQQHVGTIQVMSSTISHVLSETKSLEHVSHTKMLKLHEGLLLSLNDMTAGRSELEKDELREDVVVSLTLLLTKIARLFRQSDMSPSIKNTDFNGTGSISPYDLINALAKRAPLAQLNEVKLVEVALEILQLNFTWTSASIYRSSLLANEPSMAVDPPPLVPDELTSLSAKLEYGIRIRDDMVSLLTRYAITLNTSVNDAIKRTAFIHLLNTYLLCQGVVIPADLRLECGLEIQAKWANFIHLEIQAFIDENQSKNNSLDHLQVEEENSARPSHIRNSNKKSKDHLHPKSRTVRSIPSVNELRRVEEFDLLITTFAKSIRCGLIHFQHSGVLMKHFTRFNKIFDISVELLVATLNDTIANTPDQISEVITCLADVFKASFELYLGPDGYTEEQFIRLSRLLQSVVVLRGARMSYKPRLDSASAAQLHLDCIHWLIDKATTTLPEPEPPLLNKLGTMFRGLALLLIGIDGRSCLKIKSEMERLVQDRQFSIPDSKSWDPYQLYLKRLISVMAKDPNIKRAARLALQKQNGADAPAGEDVADQVAANNGDEMEPPTTLANEAKRKTRPRPKKLKQKAREEASSEVGEEGGGAGLGTRTPDSWAHELSSTHSHRHRGSSVVSVVIPLGSSKRKRLVSEGRPMPSHHQVGHVTPSSSSSVQKRARLSAVVIGKSRLQHGDGQPVGSGTRNGGGPQSSRPSLEPVDVGRPQTPDRALQSSSQNMPPSDDLLHPPDPLNFPHESTPPPPPLPSSPPASEISLATIKRLSRRHQQK